MPVRRIRRKFEQWRQEPEAVRLRIATLLTGGTGLVVVLLWLLVLLPLQLRFTRPAGPDEVTQELQATVESLQNGQVAGVADAPSPTPTPTPTPEVDYYHGTRPSRQGVND